MQIKAVDSEKLEDLPTNSKDIGEQLQDLLRRPKDVKKPGKGRIAHKAFSSAPEVGRILDNSKHEL